MLELVISQRQATLLELKEKYSLRDLYDIWEITYEDIRRKVEIENRRSK